MSVKYSSTSVCMVREVSLKKKNWSRISVLHSGTVIFSSESDVIPALYFTNRMGFVFENNRYRTMRLLSHPVIIFLCSPFSLSLYFFLTSVIAQAVSIETSEHIWIERAKTSSRHIIRALSCSLFTHVPCRVSTPTRTQTDFT